MKLNTRLRVTFISIIVLPLLLMVLSFLIIGAIILTNREGDGGLNYRKITENFSAVVGNAEDVFEKIADRVQREEAKLEDIHYLSALNRELAGNDTYILVRKDDQIYYSGNNILAKRIFERLPEYVGKESKGDIYLDDLGRFIRQADFSFRDGSKGSVFVISGRDSLISGKFLRDMIIATMIILFFTSFMMTRWIKKGVIEPITSLDEAMTKIKDGNFDYTLETDKKGEIGDLYRKYEDMRLRLKENDETTKESEKQNRELVSNISHDLKTPITAIKGYVEGIMDGVADTPEKVDKYIRTIYNKANDMDRLINELTTYSKIDSNRIPYKFLQINVSDYFRDCVEEVGLDLEQKGIKLNYVDMVDEKTLIIADPEQMKKVIGNIISNSVKYMNKPHPVIEIRILDEVDSIRIEIEDNGKGIEQKDLQRIFERFYRTDASRNSAQGGSGIGLSIVKKIVEDHGGYIWATSKEGEGTCMHFVLRKYIELTNEVVGGRNE